MSIRLLKFLSVFLALTLLVACQAMAPSTFSAKAGSDSSTTITSRESAEATESEPLSTGDAPSPERIPTIPDSAAALPPIENRVAPANPLSNAPSEMASTLGPIAAANDPMGPRADKEGAGDCPAAYALTHAARIRYSDSETSIASLDKTNPTPIDLDGHSTLSAHFLLEALLKSNNMDPGDCSDPTYCRWDDRAVGYVRAVITPTDASGSKYIDLKLIAGAESEPSFAEGPSDLHLGGYNLVLTGLPAPTGATIEMFYIHNIYKKALMASDPLARNPWADCNVVIGQPPDFSETPSPYTAEIQANFDTFRAEGKVHPAAAFKIIRSIPKMTIPRDRPSLRESIKLDR